MKAVQRRSPAAALASVRRAEPVIIQGKDLEVGFIDKLVATERSPLLVPKRRANIVSQHFERWTRPKPVVGLLESTRGQARLYVGDDTIFVTSSGLRTPLHSDETHGLLVHVRGRKSVVFTSDDALPDRRKSGTHADLYTVGMTADLTPGDILFVPKRQLHDVESKDATVSLSLRACFDDDLARIATFLSCRDEAARILSILAAEKAH